MILTVNKLLTKHFKKTKFDSKLASKIYKFQVNYISKNEDHMSFFGGVLTGVQILCFSDADFMFFFDELAKVDPIQIDKELSEVPDINKDWEISSDVFNLVCMYMVYRFNTSPHLNPKQKKIAAINTAMLFNYRTISALHRGWFKYPANVKVAQKTYERLTNRFLIKKLKNWQEVIEYRSKALLASDSPHIVVLNKYTPDDLVIKLLNDAYVRIRDMLKNIYAEFMIVNASGERQDTSSSTGVDFEGEDELKNKVGGYISYSDYVSSLLSDKNDFIKTQLLDIIEETVKTTDINLVVEVLEFMVNQSLTNLNTTVLNFVKLSVEHTFLHLDQHNLFITNKGDIGLYLTTLKGMLMSSRSSNDKLIELRDTGKELVLLSIDRTNEQTIASVRTAVILYVFLRAYAKEHYS